MRGNPFLEALKVYDLVRGSKEYPDCRTFIANHAAEKRMIAVHYEREIIGCAAVWPVDDPHDVESETIAPSAQKTGRYAYIPMIYIHPDYRGSGVLRMILRKVFEAFKVERIAFKRLHAPKRRKRWGKRSKNRIHVLKGFRDAHRSSDRSRSGSEGNPPEDPGGDRGPPQEEPALEHSA